MERGRLLENSEKRTMVSICWSLTFRNEFVRFGIYKYQEHIYRSAMVQVQEFGMVQVQVPHPFEQKRFFTCTNST